MTNIGDEQLSKLLIQKDCLTSILSCFQSMQSTEIEDHSEEESVIVNTLALLTNLW